MNSPGKIVRIADINLFFPALLELDQINVIHTPRHFFEDKKEKMF
jgi:hypothetical protein